MAMSACIMWPEQLLGYFNRETESLSDNSRSVSDVPAADLRSDGYFYSAAAAGSPGSTL